MDTRCNIRDLSNVLVGYVVSAAVFGVCLGFGWRLLGPRSAFQPASTLASGAWTAAMFSSSLLGGLAAGFTVRCWDTSSRSAHRLAGLLLVLGLVMAAAHGALDDPTGKVALAGRATTELSAWEASSETVAPVWAHVLTALLQTTGVLLPTRRARSTPSQPV